MRGKNREIQDTGGFICVTEVAILKRIASREKKVAKQLYSCSRNYAVVALFIYLLKCSLFFSSDENFSCYMRFVKAFFTGLENQLTERPNCLYNFPRFLDGASVFVVALIKFKPSSCCCQSDFGRRKHCTNISHSFHHKFKIINLFSKTEKKLRIKSFFFSFFNLIFI